MLGFIKRLFGSKKTPNGSGLRLSQAAKNAIVANRVPYRSAEFYEIRERMINSLPQTEGKANDELKMFIRKGMSVTQPRTTVKALAKSIIDGSAGALQIDASIQQLFPDFGKFFVSERDTVALEFVKQYLPECRLDVKLNSNEIKIYRDERLPGVGLYPHLVGYAHVKHSLAASVLAAGLFAYDYLSS